MTTGQLQGIWDELKREQPPAAGWLARRVVPDACCPIRAAIDVSNRMPALLFEVDAGAIGGGVEYPAGNGFSIVPEPLVPGAHGRVMLCLRLTERAYHDQFCALAEDVLAALAAADSQASAVAALLSRLNSWQDFMQRHSDGLSAEEQTGLFSELTFLGRVCYRLLASRALDAWKGPLGGVRDFVVRRNEVEVKATTVSASTTLHVSNLRQLDDSTCDHLLICRYALAQSRTGSTLVELVAATRELFAGHGSSTDDQLRRLLLAAGYLDMHAPKYQGRRLEVRGARYFRVSEGFPRLVPVTVPDGITEASYVVDLARCLSHEITEAAAIELISSRG